MKNLVLLEYGGYLGTEKFDFVIKKGEEKLDTKPFQSVNEISLSSGNSVSTKALAWASIYGIKTLVTSQSGRPLGVLLPLNYDSHVQTRIKQYEAYSDQIGVKIAKTIVKAKIEAQALLLEKYNIECNNKLRGALMNLQKLKANSVEEIRTKIHGIEGRFGKFYFKELIKLFPIEFRTQVRYSYKAVDVTNNLFNLSFEVLKWEVYKSIINAHLDPFLGFLHSIQHGKPSLVCDLQEAYRPLIDSFLVDYIKKLKTKDLEANYQTKKPRIFLKHNESSKLITDLNSFLDRKIKKQRSRKFGDYSKIKTVIREDTESLARFLRKDIKTWTPTVGLLNKSLRLKKPIKEKKKLNCVGFCQHVK